jgi:hypothetical protein
MRGTRTGMIESSPCARDSTLYVRYFIITLWTTTDIEREETKDSSLDADTDSRVGFRASERGRGTGSVIMGSLTVDTLVL